MMTNEITPVDGDAYLVMRRYTVASGVAIAKGTLLKLSDAFTAAASDGANDIIAGVASMDKSATDHSDSITVWTDGVFEFVCSGAIQVGEGVISVGANNTVCYEGSLSAVASGARLIGYARELGEEGETINVRMRL